MKYKNTSFEKSISKFFSMIFSPAIGFAVCILLIFIFSKKPLDSLSLFFTGTFTSRYYFGSMLNTAGFLMTAGLGASIALKSGNMNLGGEGQIYLGGYISALILSIPLQIPPALHFFIALLTSILCGATIASFSAFLKEVRGAEVLLTSFLLSAASLPLIDGLITNANGKANQNLLALPYINEEFKLHSLLPPSPFNASFFIAVILCILTWLLINKTYTGRKIQIWGTAPLFAEYAGFSSAKNSFFSLAASGALHALTGVTAICGTYFTCHKGFYAGMGWNALSAALIVSSNPLALIPASILLSWLYNSADRVGLTQGFGFDISGILQGVVLFSIALRTGTRGK